MEKRIIKYEKYLREICYGDYDEEERERLCKKVLVQIGFFQHERFIHLIVTVLFALMAIMVFGICAIEPSIPFFLLEFVILILLIPYIRHYFILENTVQRMYEHYDALRGEDFMKK